MINSTTFFCTTSSMKLNQTVPYTYSIYRVLVLWFCIKHLLRKS